MKRLFLLLTIMLFLGCSSDNASLVRRITFNVNGVNKIFEDIKVQAIEDHNFDVPFVRLQISANSADGTEFFSVVVNRGGDFDGQSRNGAAFLNGKGYHYNFEHPLTMHISTNTPQKIRGTFEGVYTNDVDGENLNITDGTIDITYLPENSLYIKK